MRYGTVTTHRLTIAAPTPRRYGGDTIYDIMGSNLAKLRTEFEEIRRIGGVKPDRLIRLARKLGRRLASRGKHPTWINPLLPNARPVSIPDHGGRELNRNTVGAILDQLEGDLDALEAITPDQ